MYEQDTPQKVMLIPNCGQLDMPFLVAFSRSEQNAQAYVPRKSMLKVADDIRWIFNAPVIVNATGFCWFALNNSK